MWSALTYETQVCITLVLVLLVALMSGVVGWRMGWDRCVDYIRSLKIADMDMYLDEMEEDLMLEQGREADHERRDM